MSGTRGGPEGGSARPSRGRAGGIGFAIAAIVLWGASFAASKVALGGLSPAALVLGRSVLGLATLSAIAPWTREGREECRAAGDSARIVLLGLIGLPLHLGLQAHALTMTSAVHSGWLIALNPVFTSVLAAVFLREPFPPLKLLGVALGFAGAAAVVTGGRGAGALGLPSTRGDFLILASSLNMAAYTLVARSLMVRLRPFATTLRATAAGAAAAVLLYALASPDLAEFGRLDAEEWTALAFLGIGCTGLGYLSWSRALERLEAGTLSSFQYAQPLVTVAVAAAWISERAGGWAWAGGALVLAGVFLVQRSAAAEAGR